MNPYDIYMAKAATEWQKMLPDLSDAAVSRLHGLGQGRSVPGLEELGGTTGLRDRLASTSHDPRGRRLLRSFRTNMRNTKTYPLGERRQLYDHVAPGVWGTRGYFPGDPTEAVGSYGRLLVAPRAMNVPITLYHGTQAKNLPVIRREGLRVPEVRANTLIRSAPDSPARDAFNRVFMTPDRATAERYARKGRDPVLGKFLGKFLGVNHVRGAVAQTTMTPREMFNFGALSTNGRTGEPEIALRHVPANRVKVKPYVGEPQDPDSMTRITFVNGKRYENGRYAPI